jgi:hypothetical protein
MPIPLQAHAQGRLRPTAAQDGKHQCNACKQEQEKERRIAWIEGRKLHSKAMGGPAPADSDAKAAATSTAAPAAVMATATRKKGAAAAAPQTAVAATYCEVAMATLPTVAAP